MSEERSALPIASGQGSNPAAPNYVPGVPTNFSPVYFQGFTGGVNTLPGRVAVADDQLAWCDGFMPIGPDSLRTIPDLNPTPIYTAPTGTTVTWFGFANIQTNFYCIVLLSNGAVNAVDVDLLTVKPILSAGTIDFPALGQATLAVSQWESLYVLLTASQNNNNGYWIWDGTNVYTSGSIGPIVTITDPGTNPALSQLVYIGFPLSSGNVTTVANAHTVFSNGGLSQVIIDSITDTTIPQGSPIIVAFGPSGGGFSSAFGTIGVSDGVIVAATLTNGGSGYTSIPTVNISDPTGTGASIVVNGASGGILTSLQVVTGGSNYTNPSISFSGGGGSNAAGRVTVANGVLQPATVWQAGGGYAGTPTVNILSATGSGGQAVPLIASGHLASLTVTAGGSNYSNPVFFTLSDGNGPAAATVDLMPFGVQGTAIEVYKSRVWISNGRAFVVQHLFSSRTIFSASDSPVDFGDDGGAFPATDAFTHFGYTKLVQVNGFLYLIADNSQNYISNIQTNSVGTPPVPVTTFSNLNTDPMTGSFWPSSVYVFGRNIMLANGNGMYISSGGAVTKVSTGLDGIWFSNPTQTFSDLDTSGAVVTLYGRNVYCVLFQVLNKISGNIEPYIMMFDGRRCFTCHQSTNLTFIGSVNRESLSFAYGTNGTAIYPMFTTPSTNFPKTVQSKLYANPAYWTTKTENELHAIFTVRLANPIVNVSIDNENATGIGAALVTLSPTASTSVLGPTPIGQQGRLMGVTLTTTAADLELNSMMIQERVETLNV